MMDYNGIANGGGMALAQALGELRAEVTQLQGALRLLEHRLGARLDTLEYVVSEELLCGLATPAEVVAEAMAGRVHPDAAVYQVGLSVLPTDEANTCGTGVDYVHSPGYPADDDLD